MSNLRIVADAILNNDSRLADWATRRFSRNKDPINIDESLHKEFQFCQLKAIYLRNQQCAHIFREDPILTEDQDRNEKIINTIFETVDYNHRPKLTDCFRTDCNVILNGFRALIVTNKHINGDESFMHSDIFYHYAITSQLSGIETLAYDSRGLLGDGVPLDRSFADELDKLEDAIRDYKPDIVVADGNFLQKERTVTVDWWLGIKEKYGFKLVSMVHDCYDSLFNFVAEWRDSADIVVFYNRLTKYNDGHPKNMLVPGVPFDASLFSQNAEKSFELGYLGSQSRFRLAWLHGMRLKGIVVRSWLHDRKIDDAPSIAQYAALMANSKLVFNNGWVTEADSIITGRLFEGILSKAVVIQEVGSNVDDYFNPFIDYIPVSNITQAVAFSKYLLKYEDKRMEIANHAYDYYMENYSSEKFWKALVWRLYRQ